MGEKGKEEQWALPGPHSSSSCLSPLHPRHLPEPHPTLRRPSSVTARRLATWPVHTDLRVASHVMHIDAQEVAQPMRHEHSSQVGLDHGVDAATQDANAGQLLQVDAVGQAVHVRPPNTCGSKGGYSELWQKGLG